MDSTRIHIPNELFASAESSHFEGKLELPELVAGPDVYAFAEPLPWQVDITNTGEALLVAGTVRAEATTACARCLEDVFVSLEGQIEGYFLLGEEGEATPEDLDDDEFDVLPDDHVIDVEPLVVAALLVDVPLVPLCDEECKGLCATCGANLNEGPCGCDATARDEEFDLAKNPFAALKDYKFED